MPGLFGFNKTKGGNDGAVLQRGLNLLTHADGYRQDPVYEDEKVIAGRTHLGVIGEPTSPRKVGAVHCWVEGEVFNLEELRKSGNYREETFAGILAEALDKDSLRNLLRRANGQFAAALYDSTTQELHLLSDRLGIKPLYWWQQGENLAWCSELKGFLALPHFIPVINRTAVDCFLELGFVAGNATWFEGVERMPAASCLSFKVGQSSVGQKERYWHWSDIVPVDLRFREAVSSAGEIWEKAVRQRCTGEQPLGISISGGLDSRAIVAAFPKERRAPTLFTFGKTRSWDLRLAQRVARQTGWQHHVLLLSGENWLDARWQGVWKTDGFKNLLHLHFSQHQKTIRQWCSINLNGFLGGVAFGGIYASEHPGQRISAAVSAQYLGRFAELDEAGQDFYDLSKVDPYLINNRIRRFSAAGLTEWACLTEQRLPFADHALLEFLYGLPDRYRSGSRLFNAFLLERYPALFNQIPWQRTGLPIRKALLSKAVMKGKWRQVQQRLGVLPNYTFTDYPAWIRTQESAATFRSLLDPAEAIYPDYVLADLRTKWLEPHLAGRRNFAEQIGRAATLEYWLRRVFNRNADL